MNNQDQAKVVNKQTLIEAIAENSGLTKTDSEKALNGFTNAITKSLKKGKEVRLVGFGTFAVAHRKETVGRNPRTGEKIKIPASKQPKFKPGKIFKDAIA